MFHVKHKVCGQYLTCNVQRIGKTRIKMQGRKGFLWAVFPEIEAAGIGDIEKV